ncbi:MAG TPA: nuclear pore complex subunit [Bacteroidales bacterium]|jgi:hypothetical protein|nr:nuclear pore complex subunit [Bacteroidales bacterium]
MENLKQMDRINLLGTDKTPRIIFETTGELYMGGRVICDNAEEFFSELIQFCTNLKENSVVFDINIEYLNTPSSKKLFQLFNSLEANKYIKNVNINWFYDSDDMDMKEVGTDYSELFTKLNFSFVILYENLV